MLDDFISYSCCKVPELGSKQMSVDFPPGEEPRILMRPYCSPESGARCLQERTVCLFLAASLHPACSLTCVFMGIFFQFLCIEQSRGFLADSILYQLTNNLEKAEMSDFLFKHSPAQ